ncbi:MAG TPA: beta-ketoacyl synthase N-terminal-like domain-containing protein, partial [Candidatus Limnocylindrales bacterium]
MSRSERRVVITGMGVMSGIGVGVEATWDGLIAGRSGVTRINTFEPERVDSKIAASVGEFDASRVLDRKELRRADRYTQLGLMAAREALDQAGLPGRLEGALAEATGIILGTGLGGVNTLCEQIEINATRGPDRVSPFFVPMAIPNVGAGQLSI